MFKHHEESTLHEILFDNEIYMQEEETSKLGKVSFVKTMMKFFAVSFVFLIVSSIALLEVAGLGIQVASPLMAVWKNIPSTLPDVEIAQHNVFYDKNGQPFATLYTEDREELNSLSQISSYAQQGIVDTEDKRFYQDKGFDLVGTIRSAALGSGGGSGITQQLVKNLQYYNLLGKSTKTASVEHSYARKIKELKMATEYDKTHTKDQILLGYFNVVAFGGPNVYGIQSASKYFFNKNAKDLDLAQSAALVGTAQNASLYNLALPSDYNKWKKRQTEVLNRMYAENHITKSQMIQAENEKLSFSLKHNGGGTCYSSKYPAYCEYVLNYLENDTRLASTQQERDAIIAKGGLQVHTFLDPEAMDKTNNYLASSFGNTNRIVAPTAVVQPGTGGVAALAQNRAWGNGDGKSELILPDMKSGEGSVYKIFMLAAALNNGMTPDQLSFASAGCPLYPGKNYDAPPGGFKNSVSCDFQGGDLNYKQAVAYSSNTWFVTLEMRVGVEKLKAFSKSVGLSAPDDIGPRSLSYTLGSVENSPVNLAAAFATFANKGVYCPPTPVQAMNYTDGSNVAVPDDYDPSVDACRAVMSEKNAGIVLGALRSNIDGSIPKSFGHKSEIDGYDTAGKSGTNENLNSTWAYLSSYYSIFTNVYDFVTPSRGIDVVHFKGEDQPWYNNSAQAAGTDMLRLLLNGKKNIPMQYNGPDEWIPTTVDTSAFFVLPSFVGLNPDEAVNAAQNLGITVHVSKDTVKTPSGYPTGVIVKQSIPEGQKLSKGTQKQLILYTGA